MADEIRLGADFSKVESEAADASRAIDRIGDSATKTRDFLQEVEDDARASMAGVGKATDEASKSTGDLGKGIVDLDGLMGTLAAGGVSGLKESLSGLAASLTGPAGITLGLTALTVAYEALKGPVGDFLSGLVNGANKIPPLADNLANLKERLGEVEKGLKDLREKQSLTNAELETYNRLVGEQAVAEKAVNVERERRKALDEEAAGGKPAAGASDAARKAIAAGGGFDVVSDEAANALDSADPEIAGLRAKIAGLNKELTRGFAEIPGYVGKVITDRIDEAQKAIDARTGGNRTAANELLGKARDGETAAIARLAGLLPAGGFNSATPEGLQSAKDAEEAARREAKYAEQLDKDRQKADAKRDKEREKEAEKRAADEQKAAITATNNAYAAREKAQKEARKEADAAEKKRAAGDVRSARALERSMNQRLPAAPKPLDDQLIMNQQMMADQMQRQMMWQQQQMMQAQFVPSLLQYGGL